MILSLSILWHGRLARDQFHFKSSELSETAFPFEARNLQRECSAPGCDYAKHNHVHCCLTSDLHPHPQLAVLSSSQAGCSDPGRGFRCTARRMKPACPLPACWCL